MHTIIEAYPTCMKKQENVNNNNSTPTSTRLPDSDTESLVDSPRSIRAAGNGNNDIWGAIDKDDLNLFLGLTRNFDVLALCEAERLLQKACSRDSREIAKWLLNVVDVDTRGCVLGETGLHFAALKGKLGCIEVLIEHGAAIDAETKGGCTPLYFSVCNGHYDCVAYLISKGANVNIVTKSRSCPLAVALYKKYKEIAELLIKYGGHHNYDNMIKKEDNTTNSSSNIIIECKKKRNNNSNNIITSSQVVITSTKNIVENNDIIHVNSSTNNRNNEFLDQQSYEYYDDDDDENFLDSFEDIQISPRILKKTQGTTNTNITIKTHNNKDSIISGTTTTYSSGNSDDDQRNAS